MVNLIKMLLSRPRLAFEGFLVIALLLAGWRYNMAQDELQRAKDEHATLEEDLREKITLKDGQIEILKRRPDGTVVVRRPYVPPEGSIVIKKKDLSHIMEDYKKVSEALKNAKTPEEFEELRKKLEKLNEKIKEGDDDDGDIIVQNKGFTFKPGYGIEAGNDDGSFALKPRLDFKWGFWDRYSGLVGISEYGLGAGVSRHLDDWLWFRPRNVELFAEYKFARFKQQHWAATVGIRSNF